MAQTAPDVKRDGVELRGEAIITTLPKTYLVADGYVRSRTGEAADVAVVYTERNELVGYVVLEIPADAEVEHSVTFEVEQRESFPGRVVSIGQGQLTVSETFDTTSLTLSKILPVGERQVILPLRIPWTPTVGEYMLKISIHKGNSLLVAGGVGFHVR